MQYFVITYNIDNAKNRVQFVNDFEQVLAGLGFHKEHTNQSTYFGQYRGTQDLFTTLFNSVSRMVWTTNDAVTIYFPKVLQAIPRNKPNIGRHEFKSIGSNILNHIVFQ